MIGTAATSAIIMRRIALATDASMPTRSTSTSVLLHFEILTLRFCFRATKSVRGHAKLMGRLAHVEKALTAPSMIFTGIYAWIVIIRDLLTEHQLHEYRPKTQQNISAPQ